jgi:hypothetical protein
MASAITPDNTDTLRQIPGAENAKCRRRLAEARCSTPFEICGNKKSGSPVLSFLTLLI